MKARIAVARPEEVELTLTVTMTMADWKRIGAGLTEARWNGTIGDLSTVIREAVAKASAHFEGETDSAAS